MRFVLTKTSDPWPGDDGKALEDPPAGRAEWNESEEQWEIEIGTLEELMSLAVEVELARSIRKPRNTPCDLILLLRKPLPGIEIYDDYRE